MSRLKLFLAVLCLGAPIATSEAHAWWRVGVNIGIPICPGPCYPWGYYYHPYPYYVAPAPVVVVPAAAPAAVAVQPVPAAAVVQSAPAPTVTPVATSPTPAVGPPPTVVQANHSDGVVRIEGLLQQLSQPQENVRRDAALDLGRLKAAKAVDPLVRMLATDNSPVVRDAAARALGLIASPASLNALIQAAQVDSDRDVRHSAQFAVEIIRTNLRGN
jgi:hypothetical protein